MAEKIPFSTMMHTGPRAPLKKVAEYITCPLCKGYLIDATTIVECLHTFCRSCIVKYLEKNKYCPVCDVQVHKTKPLLNLRADTTIQNIVYKLVPRLYHDEMKKRKVYYDTHPEAKPTFFELTVEELYENFLTPEETLCLTLSYNGCEKTARYFRCPSAVNVAHIKRLIRAKYELTEHHRVDILYNQDCLSPDLSLMDVAYIYSWKRNTPLELTYKIYECRAKKPKLEPADSLDKSNLNIDTSNNNNNWKEVQLRISESGEMSITGIQDGSNLLTLLDSDNFQQEVIINESSKPICESSEEAKTEKDKNENKSPAEKIKSPKKPRTPSKAKKISVKTETIDKTVQNNTFSTKKELPGLKLIINRPKTDTNKGSLSQSITSATSAVSNSVTDTINRVLANSELTVTTTTATEIKPAEVEMNILMVSVSNTPSLGAVKTVFSTINTTKCSSKLEEPKDNKETETKIAENINLNDPVKPETVKRKRDDQACDIPLKIPKPTILNHSLSLINNLSSNHPLNKHSNKFNRNGEHLKSINEVEKFVSSAATIISNCVLTTSVKVTSAVSESSAKPIILNQNIIQAGQNQLGKLASITVPSYTPNKHFYSPTVSASKPTINTQAPIAVSRSNPTSNDEGKVGANSTKHEVSLSISTSVPSQPTLSLSLPNASKTVSTQNSIPLPHNTPFLLNSSISTALKHPGITTFSTHLTPSTGFNHSTYIPSPTNLLQTTPQPIKTLLPPTSSASQPSKPKPSTPLGYKTLRDPPKSWNAQIAKANQNVKTAAANQAIAAAGAGTSNGPTSGKFADLKSVRPAKFFKQRNMPRYLGNPASGVKPMFPVQTSPDKDKGQSTSTPTVPKPEKSEIKKHSIVKIDPKTLKPISEKAPETATLCNVSNTPSAASVGSSPQQLNTQEQRVPSTTLKDLRINTSSVSIFNPLKLQQSSPKGDRKSPKSPHSPKPKTSTHNASSTTVTTVSNLVHAPPVSLSPTSNKRDQKPNLTFTPANPFVPNMTAPALSPNQFLYPTGAPAGFPPTCDPRLMAAYHSFWYSQRLAAAGFHGAFPGGLAGLSNLRMPIVNNTASHQQHSPEISPKHSTPPKSSTPTQQSSRDGSGNGNSTLKSPASKKSRDSLSKSLETALEKLTQNKVRELGAKSEKPSTTTVKGSLPTSVPLVPSKPTNSVHILPPIVPNVESIEKTLAAKVPVERRAVESQKTNSKAKKETSKDKEVHNTSLNQEKCIDNQIEAQKSLQSNKELPKNASKSAGSEIKSVKVAKDTTGLFDSTPKQETNQNPVKEKTESSQVMFSNVLSLTNAASDNKVLTKNSGESSHSGGKAGASPLSIAPKKENKALFMHSANAETKGASDIGTKCDSITVDNGTDKVVSTKIDNVKNKDSTGPVNDSSLSDISNKNDNLKCGEVTNKTVEISTNPAKQNKNEKLNTESLQIESKCQSSDKKPQEASAINKESVVSVSKHVNQQGEIGKQHSVVLEEKNKV